MPAESKIWRDIEALRKEIEAIAVEKARRRRDNPAKYFVPNGKQEQFIKLTDNVRIFCGGNSSGKSAILANCLINLCLGAQNEWFLANKQTYSPSNIRRQFKIRLVSTPTSIKENIIPELKRWLPRGSWQAYRDGKTWESKWRIGNSLVDMMTYEQGVNEFESVTRDVVMFDEPPPEPILNANLARLRFGGIVFMTFTPLSISAHIYDRFLKVKTPGVGVVYSSMEDNCIEHGVRGVIPHKEIARLIDLYRRSGDEVDARIEGKFMHLSGRVLKYFNPKIHIVEPFIIPSTWPSYFAVDPHDNQPFISAWCCVSPSGEVYFYDEDDSTDLVRTFVEMVIKKEGQHTSRTLYRYIDPNYGLRRNSTTGKTLRTEIEESAYSIGYRMTFDLPNDSLVLGHKVINSYLYFNPDEPKTIMNRPRLFFFAGRVPKIIEAVENYTFKRKRNETIQGKSDEVEKKYKGWIDVIRYIMVSNPVFTHTGVTLEGPRLTKRSVLSGFKGGTSRIIAR